MLWRVFSGLFVLGVLFVLEGAHLCGVVSSQKLKQNPKINNNYIYNWFFRLVDCYESLVVIKDCNRIIFGHFNVETR